MWMIWYHSRSKFRELAGILKLADDVSYSSIVHQMIHYNRNVPSNKIHSENLGLNCCEKWEAASLTLPKWSTVIESWRWRWYLRLISDWLCLKIKGAEDLLQPRKMKDTCNFIVVQNVNFSFTVLLLIVTFTVVIS